jgi:hypothetical protein
VVHNLPAFRKMHMSLCSQQLSLNALFLISDVSLPILPKHTFRYNADAVHKPLSLQFSCVHMFSYLFYFKISNFNFCLCSSGM